MLAHIPFCGWVHKGAPATAPFADYNSEKQEQKENQVPGYKRLASGETTGTSNCLD